MEKEEQKKQAIERPEKESKSSIAGTTAPIIEADGEKAERLPTVPLDSLKAIGELEPPVVSVHSVESTRTFSVPTPLVVQPAEYHRSTGEWMRIFWDGIRPSYLSLSLFPFLFGTVLAWSQQVSSAHVLGHFRLLSFVLSLVALLLVHMGANLINDYYDYIRGVDTSNPLGPGGLIQQGLIKPTRVLVLGLIFLGASALSGLATVLISMNWMLALFGLVGLLFAYFYSGSGKSLAALCLGPLVALGIFGPLVTIGAYIVQGGGDLHKALLYSLPLGLTAAATILVNDMRDLEGDEQARKFTLANRLGLTWSRAIFLVLLLAAYGFAAFLAVPSHTPHWLLLAFLTLPLLVNIVTGILRASSPNSLHLVFRDMLRQNAWFGVLLLIGLIVSTLVSAISLVPTHLMR
ncbi:hypothetical protein KSC_077100 [Ktedonobacter sp. SOSP1-52]|uniref:1,4-dihydroxy-2-naphthoate octaprenyltransferase n=1 Tax=Ktedonobacter sp. SOSP1-52 TaxID=2778366 RepID=UPI0019159191|nr:1,4-dihydroxy-2-naphthoate octaprenyltransferase [Ktedonobacter sp. SOSP1-52]GHO68818.1 hypothetical protein KSC_077100 [Ktedonobacter sp. SOSP1-52]